MKTVKLAACLLSLFLLLTACGQDKDPGAAAPPEPGQTTGTTGPGQTGSEDMDGSAGQLYSLVFQTLFNMDEALNDGMKYIAIDLSPLTQLTDEDKAYILDSLGSHGVEVRDTTFDRLKEEEEHFKEILVLEGVMLRIEKADIGRDSAVIEGSKYRSGTGAVGAKITLKLKDKAWSVTDSGMTWIS
ncbi:peptide ABC transporter substrate-binding protein [Paenibacillus sp. M1]|uniref:Peptide ABC transporter substrate-binding protein n=1 Tax=Paenibacillus haidiansis TaxID=1574488 RepID=A0ABU7VSH1_9BACL